MPRYDQDMENFVAPGNYGFSGMSIQRLEASKYTLVTICVDATPSVARFRNLIIETIKTVIKGCALNKIIADNVLIRIVYFNTRIGVSELHGYKELGLIDVENDYNDITFDGWTNLYDATMEVLEVNDKYSENLRIGNYDNNSIIFVLTDGQDNDSSNTQLDVSVKLEDIRRKEITESILFLLIGLNTDDAISSYLSSFRENCKFDDYIDAKELTPEKAAKIANFMVNMISSQSSSCGTGSPSKVLKF